MIVQQASHRSKRIDEDSVSARGRHQMRRLRRVGHLDSLVFKAPLDLEVDLLDAREVLRVVEVLTPMGGV